MRLSRKLGYLAALALGLIFGVLGTTRILYNRPGSAAVLKIKKILGLVTPVVEESHDDKYAFGHDTHLDMERATLVKSELSPNWNLRRGLEVALVATGFTYPINIVFVREPDSAPDSPAFYVNELNGVIKYVANDRTVHTYASGLLNYVPIKQRKSSETGLSGLTAVPGSRDLIITRSVFEEKTGLLQNEVVRLFSTDDGKSMKREQVLKRLEEYTSPSNQIQQVVFGPDGMLYVSVGDAENHQISLDLSKFGGKILRMTPSGEPCEDNPYYATSTTGSPTQYIFASGVRNVFDLDFQPGSGRLFGVDNGKNLDRLFEIRKGSIYGWNGDFNTTRLNALWTWGPINNTAPVGIVFPNQPILGANTAGRCYVATYGPPGVPGPTPGKSIWEFDFDASSGLLKRTPNLILKYIGSKQANVLGLAEGPDGLYFTDFFGESGGDPESPTGNIWRLFPSKTTDSLASVGDQDSLNLSPQERGEQVFRRNCTQCHTLDGNGGSEGPNLTYVKDELVRRLNSSGYLAEIEKLRASDQAFFIEQRPRLDSVIKAKTTDERIRLWLAHHLEEPRFDNPFSKMPSFALSLDKSKRDDVIEFIMRRPQARIQSED